MQKNPRDQLKAVIFSIQGDLSNEIHSIGTTKSREIRLSRMKKNLEFVQNLLSKLDPGEWNDETLSMEKKNVQQICSINSLYKKLKDCG